MFNDIAYCCLENYSIEEIKNEQTEIMNILIDLKSEQKKLKSSYYIYNIYNTFIAVFSYIMIGAVTVVPYFLFGAVSIITILLSNLFLFSSFYIIGKIPNNIFKGEDLIEDYKDINKAIPYYEKKLNKLNCYLEKNKLDKHLV